MKALPINHVESVIVSYDPDGEILLVGKKDYRQNVEVINAFQGEAATEIFNMLITQKKNKTPIFPPTDDGIKPFHDE